MDAKKIIEKLRGETDRTTMSLYLSQSVYEEFKATCGAISPSRVLEELMKDFIEKAPKIPVATTRKKKN